MEHNQDSDSEHNNNDDLPHSEVAMDRKTRLREVELQAYYCVLRAFKAQSKALSAQKIQMITDLMTELKVTYREHKYYLDIVDKDDFIREIRGDLTQEEEQKAPTPVTTSKPLRIKIRKKQKTSQSDEEHTPLDPSGSEPSSSGVSSHDSWGKVSPASLIGRKVYIRLPGEDEYNEFVIKQYNPEEGLHSLESENDTMDDPCSWVDLKEIPSEDIMWQGDDPGISRQPCSLKPGQTVLRPTSTFGRKRGSTDSQFKVPPLPHKDKTGEKPPKEVEKVTSETPPDPSVLERTKKIRNDQEKEQVDATESIGDLSPDEQVKSDGEQAVSQQPETKVEKPEDEQKKAVTSSDESAVEITSG